MADKSWHTQTQSQSKAGSAVLDMDMDLQMDDGLSDASDYDNTNRFQEPRHPSNAGGKTMADDIRQRMGENVTQMVWQAGTQGARRAWTLYGNIDILRPYFDVEPKEVQMRLIYSLIPVKPGDQRQQVPKELYGPTMVVLTLIAILLYQMKTADHRVEEGTLMGSAFGVCFMYWLGSSCLVWFVTYVCNIRITILQILSMMGYALFGHCIVLFLGTVVHTSHDHMFFYFLWALVGGLSTLRMAGIIMSRTRGKTERLVVIGTIAALHLLYLLYLHFAYHTIVEELSDALNQNLVPIPAAQGQAGMDEGKEQVQEAARDVVLPSVLKHLPSNLTETGGAKLPDLGASQQLNIDAEGPKLSAPTIKPGSILLSKLKNTGTVLA